MQHKVSRQLAQWFWRRRHFKVLTIAEHGACLGHVTWTKNLNFLSLFAERLHMNLIQIGPVVSEEKPFENIDRQLT